MADRVTLINPTRKDAAPDIVHPVCPHCNADPCSLQSAQFAFPNGLVGGVFFCAACRKILSVQATGAAQPSRIVKPL